MRRVEADRARFGNPAAVCKSQIAALFAQSRTASGIVPKRDLTGINRSLTAQSFDYEHRGCLFLFIISIVIPIFS